MELEAIVLERSHLETVLVKARADWHQAKLEFIEGVEVNDSLKRAGGLMEADLADQRRSNLRSRVEAKDAVISVAREALLRRRIKRKQVETLDKLIRDAAADATARKAQQTLDDWYSRGKRVVVQPIASYLSVCGCRTSDGDGDLPSQGPGVEEETST